MGSVGHYNKLPVNAAGLKCLLAEQGGCNYRMDIVQQGSDFEKASR